MKLYVLTRGVDGEIAGAATTLAAALMTAAFPDREPGDFNVIVDSWEGLADECVLHPGGVRGATDGDYDLRVVDFPPDSAANPPCSRDQIFATTFAGAMRDAAKAGHGERPGVERDAWRVAEALAAIFEQERDRRDALKETP